jgi:Helix-turn-helix domain
MSIPITPAASPLLKEAEAAEWIRVEVATLRRWRWAKRGPRYLKIGAAVRYDPLDLAEFLQSGRISTSNQGTTVP